MEKWQLSDASPSPEMSINFIAFATSPHFGPVVLKVGVPHPELCAEVRALRLYRGDHTCRCYDHDRRLGAMILERILPGGQLAGIPNSSERSAVAAHLARALLRQQPDSGFSTLSAMAGRLFEGVRGHVRASGSMGVLVDRAARSLREMESWPTAFLHGDLHHYNILRDGDRAWKAIDPKGLIGPAPMQVARFMINELDLLPPTRWCEGMEEMTSVFGRSLGAPRAAVAHCAFFDKVLSTCWKLEEHAEGDRGKDIEQCEFLLRYLSFLLPSGEGHPSV